jgi:hypothetical protein
LKFHRPAKTSFKLADWPAHNYNGGAIIHPNDSRKFAVVTDDITGPEPVGMGFTGQPDDAKKLRLVFVVGDSLGVSHKLLGVEIAKTAKARKTRPADYHMVNHFNLQKLASADEVAGHFDVGFARGRVPAGVLMCQHDSRCGGHNCQTKNFGG